MIIVTKCSFAVGLVTSVTLCLQAAVSVLFLCLCASMSKKKCPNFTKFSVPVAVAGSFFWRSYNTICTSGFFHIMPNSDNPERPFVNRAYCAVCDSPGETGAVGRGGVCCLRLLCCSQVRCTRWVTGHYGRRSSRSAAGRCSTATGRPGL